MAQRRATWNTRARDWRRDETARDKWLHWRAGCDAHCAQPLRARSCGGGGTLECRLPTPLTSRNGTQLVAHWRRRRPGAFDTVGLCILHRIANALTFGAPCPDRCALLCAPSYTTRAKFPVREKHAVRVVDNATYCTLGTTERARPLLRRYCSRLCTSLSVQGAYNKGLKGYRDTTFDRTSFPHDVLHPHRPHR